MHLHLRLPIPLSSICFFPLHHVKPADATLSVKYTAGHLCQCTTQTTQRMQHIKEGSRYTQLFSNPSKEKLSRCRNTEQIILLSFSKDVEVLLIATGYNAGAALCCEHRSIRCLPEPHVILTDFHRLKALPAMMTFP